MIRSFDRRLVRLAVIGTAVGALALGGCGRKGPLDPPPSASLSDNHPAPSQPSLGESPEPGFLTGFSDPPHGSSSQAAAPANAATPAQPAEKKTFVLDWLLK